MEEFPSNSASQPQDYTKPGKARADDDAPKTEDGEEVRVQKVVTTKVVRRKRSPVKKFKETFISGEDARTVTSTVWYDTVIPGLKEILFAGIKEGAERTLFGDLRPSTRAAITSAARRTVESSGFRYDKVPGKIAREDPRLSRRARATHDFDELIIEHRVEAEETLTRMYDLLERYGEVTVYDLYGMLNERAEHTDRKYGWKQLAGAQVLRARGGGYVLDLPRPEVLD